MKKILLSILLLLVLPKNLFAGVVGVVDIEEMEIFEIDSDPRMDAGIDAKPGSFAMWDDSSVGKMFFKFGTGANDWFNFITGGAGSGSVSSFKGRIGTVVPLSGDYPASLVPYTPSGALTSIQVQDALDELENEKIYGASNVGGGITLFSAKNSVTLEFRTLTSPTSSISRVVNGDEVELDVDINSVASGTNVSGNDTLLIYDDSVGGIRKVTASQFSISSPVQSVNTYTGAVVLDTDDIDEGSTNLYYTEGRVTNNTSVSTNTTHRSLTNNPHSVTKAQVLLGNADNTSDANKPISIATQNALDLKYNASNPDNFIDSLGAPIQTVNAKTGDVVLSTSDISEGTNLYYTEGRVSSNTSVVANTAKVSADGSINTHSDTDISSPANGELLLYSSGDWINSSVFNAIDHGNLSGLSGDDHPQYLLHNGTRAMTGNLNLGTKNITNVNTVDGVDVSDHSARHLPSGSDPLTTGVPSSLTPDLANAEGSAESFSRSDHVHNIPADAPITNLTSSTTNTEGTATSFSRSDHVHAIDTGVPIGLSPDSGNSAGVSTDLIRADHVHNVPTDAPTITLSPATTNAEGTGTSFSRNDHQHAIATAVVGNITTVNSGDAASAGVLNNFARGDHQHAVATATAIGLSATTSNTEGASTSLARANHTHAIATGAASTQIPAQANATGTSVNLARADHIHNIPVATPVNTASTNSEGVAASFARSDHVHDVTLTRFYQNTTTSQVVTCGGVDTIITNTTLTPNVSGTYLIIFSGLMDANNNNNNGINYQFYLNGGAIASTLRSGSRLDLDSALAANIIHVQSFNGTTDALNLRANCDNSSSVWHQRSISAIRLGP